MPSTDGRSTPNGGARNPQSKRMFCAQPRQMLPRRLLEGHPRRTWMCLSRRASKIRIGRPIRACFRASRTAQVVGHCSYISSNTWSRGLSRWH